LFVAIALDDKATHNADMRQAKTNAPIAGTKTGIEPSFDEWGFFECDPEKSYWCMGYEYAREAEAIRKLYARDKRTRKNFDRAGNWEHRFAVYRECTLGMLTELVGYLYFNFPKGFPDQPYDQHDIPEQSKMLDAMHPSVLFVESATTEDGKNFFVGDEEVTPADVHTLYVNWSAPDKYLVPSFVKWLKAHRPRPSTELRGKASLPFQFQKYLKALSVYRLLRTLTISEAVELANQMVAERKLTAVPYSDKKEWNEANRLAQKIISIFCSGQIDLGDPDQKQFATLLIQPS
jgi:hypothetical protein